VPNSLAYYDKATISAIKKFIALAPGLLVFSSLKYEASKMTPIPTLTLKNNFGMLRQLAKRQIAKGHFTDRLLPKWPF
jgi:hypothetical protein